MEYFKAAIPSCRRFETIQTTRELEWLCSTGGKIVHQRGGTIIKEIFCAAFGAFQNLPELWLHLE